MTKLYKIVRVKKIGKKQRFASNKPRRSKGALGIVFAFFVLAVILLVGGAIRKSEKIHTFEECMNESGHQLVTSPSQPRKCISKNGSFYVDETQLHTCSKNGWITSPQFCK